MSFISGQRIGNYCLLRKLGQGGFGEVWLAERKSQFLTKRVAIKLPHDDQVDLNAIRREAELWERASGHPNVIPIIDADIYDGQIVIVSEYADGGSLADLLKARSKLTIDQSVSLITGILSGLDFLHTRQIIHRDIKPQNILLQGTTPRLADFGISRAMNSSTISSVVVGTDSYMAPEAFEGVRNVQTDLWSVGVVFYQLLKGELPFPQNHPSERMFAVIAKPFEPLPSNVPSNYRAIVENALAKLPTSRYRSALEMKIEIESIHREPNNSTTRPGLPLRDDSTIVVEDYTKIRPYNPPPFPQNRSNPMTETMSVNPYQNSPSNYPGYHQASPLMMYQKAPGNESSFGEGKLMSGLCYLGNFVCMIGAVLGLIILLVERYNKVLRFHAFQSLLLAAFFLLISIANAFFSGLWAGGGSNDLATLSGIITGLLGLVYFFCIIAGAIQGFRGQYIRFPVIGPLADRWA